MQIAASFKKQGSPNDANFYFNTDDVTIDINGEQEAVLDMEDIKALVSCLSTWMEKGVK